MTGSNYELWLTAAGILVLLGLSAFFNGSETGLTAVSRARMHTLEQDGDTRAASVNKILSAPGKMIGTVLIGNTLVDILAASLATSLAVQLFGDAGVLVATALMTVLVVIFASVLPKTFAIAQPERTALLIAPVMRLTITTLKPLTAATEVIVRNLLKLTPSAEDDKANILSAHEELRGAIDLHHKEGAVAQHDRDMLGGILDLKELTVSDVMVHRMKMKTISAADPAERIVEEALGSAYSRIPVWKGEPENIIGVLHIKDILAAFRANGWSLEKLEIEKVVAKPWFVPDTRPLKDQLSAFLRRKTHFALVVDEYGEVMGLVTLEDIIEEIVGQISDEFDEGDSMIRPQADGRVLVDGSVPIRDLNRQMGWDLPDDEATTIAGLVIHEAEAIPESGQAFTFHGYRFEIMRRSRNRIIALRMTPLAEKTAEA